MEINKWGGSKGKMIAVEGKLTAYSKDM